MNKLQEYVRRRDFERTPEPPPQAPQKARGPLRFVVQAHAARSLHWDFRLQMEDVLVSWAIPKGPSLDPKNRRLAILTEDHPLEYGDFEGVIPEGQYGGGSVIVWDQGTWEPEGDAQEGFQAGKLRFTLHGKKLTGRFSLFRTKRGDPDHEAEGGSSWLLIKGRDAAAREEAEEESIVDRAPESVLSGRTLEDVANTPALRSPQSLPGALERPFPRDRAPQLATLVSAPPEGDEFLHEAKLDGYRLLAVVRAGSAKAVSRSTAQRANHVELWTRGNQEWSERFPSLVQRLSELPLGNVLLDGELVAFDERGRSSFQLLQNAIGSKKEAELVYVVFDLLHQDGYDLRNVPLIERKAALQELLATAGADPRRLRFSEHVIGRGAEFFGEVCELGLEGIVSKRIDAPYRKARSRSWLKCKCIQRQEFVIGGYTDPSGSRSALGALLVGLYDESGKLRYSGKVGTGFTDRSLEELQARLSKLAQSRPAFSNPPRGAAARGVHWVRPELLAEVAYSEITDAGKLRHPSFQGLRQDKPAREVTLERPARVALTHPERVVYPEQGVTKRELAEYYERVADRILPHVGERLLTLVRCPGGQGKPCFFQKHAKEGLPEAIYSHAEGEAGAEHFVYVRDAAGLVALVQVGVLEIHVWGSTVERLEYPDRLVFDLDPDPELGWAPLVEAALDVREELESAGLRSFVKTTGGKGLHVTAPLTGQSAWNEAKAFSRAVADRLVKKRPSRYVATMAKEKREGKIFIDYLRNARGATAIAPYSTRARPGAPVATPVAWQELERDLRAEFSLGEVLARLSSERRDPWADFFEVEQSISEGGTRGRRGRER